MQAAAVRQEWLTTKQTEAMAGACGATLRRWAAKDLFPRPHRVGVKGWRRWKTAEVLAWLAARGVVS